MGHIEPYGTGSYGKPNVQAYFDGPKFRVGKFCSIAGEVTVMLSAEHRHDWATTYPFPAKMHKVWPEVKEIKGHPASKGDVVLENDVWVGFGATIMSGVTVSSGAVIGAGAVVTRSVPYYAIVAGNPATVVRFRFDHATIRDLVALGWWDWPIEKIRENVHLLCSPNVDEFLRRHR